MCWIGSGTARTSWHPYGMLALDVPCDCGWTEVGCVSRPEAVWSRHRFWDMLASFLGFDDCRGLFSGSLYPSSVLSFYCLKMLFVHHYIFCFIQKFFTDVKWYDF